jgi:hypothetical protein
MHHQSPVFAALDDQRLRPHLENDLGRAGQVVFAAQLPRLSVSFSSAGVRSIQ